MDTAKTAKNKEFTPTVEDRQSQASRGEKQMIQTFLSNTGIVKKNATTTAFSRILIVEDDTDSAYLMQMFLESQGYQVEIAFDGIEGIALARQFSPDVILSDISLTKEMDGYTLAKTIRNDSKLNSICLIAISGFGQLEDKEAAKVAGFDAHLTKPLNLEQIHKAIAQTMAQRGVK